MQIWYNTELRSSCYRFVKSPNAFLSVLHTMARQHYLVNLCVLSNDTQEQPRVPVDNVIKGLFVVAGCDD